MDTPGLCAVDARLEFGTVFHRFVSALSTPQEIRVFISLLHGDTKDDISPKQIRMEGLEPLPPSSQDPIITDSGHDTRTGASDDTIPDTPF